ncbi:hypothetical protein DPMN_104276 [Dreissena polymorpha]|uniref:Uncharacterized protein n=1 Tax=Dreissena polymorpha TaxID=45954 RepID=A0A9D4HFE6_DREPO|nr:hypothetical protein DPMN_104276 [Dreissena polymorpha]
MGTGASTNSYNDSTLNKGYPVITRRAHASTDIAVTHDNKKDVDTDGKNEASSKRNSNKQEERVSRMPFQDKIKNLETIHKDIKKLLLRGNVTYHIVKNACQRLDDLQKIIRNGISKATRK